MKENSLVYLNGFMHAFHLNMYDCRRRRTNVDSCLTCNIYTVYIKQLYSDSFESGL